MLKSELFALLKYVEDDTDIGVVVAPGITNWVNDIKFSLQKTRNAAGEKMVCLLLETETVHPEEPELEEF